MSLIDFSQEARHHGFLHIIVKDLGEESSSFFDAVLQTLINLPPIQLTEPKGTVLFLRFLNSKELPPWALDGLKWSQFSPHKQILGVLGVCRCYDLDDLDNVLAGFRSYSAQFKGDLCESRCVIYGSKSELDGGNIDPKKGHCLIDCCDHTQDDIHIDNLGDIVKEFARVIYAKLKSKVAQLERSLLLPTTSPVLRSPFEESNRLDDDSEFRLLPVQIKARLEKQLGDLNLLTGDVQAAFNRYSKAISPSRGDFLWHAAINEGLAVTAIITKMQEEVLGQKAQGLLQQGALGSLKKLTRGGNPSTGSVGTPTARSTMTLDPRRNSPATPFDRMKSASLRGTSNGEGVHNGGLVMRNPDPGGPRQYSLPHSALSDEEGSGGEGDEEEEDEENWLQVDQAMLRKDYSVEKFNTALQMYSKAKHHGSGAHLEALLKFSRYLIEQKRYRVASDQLQKMLKIDDPLFISDTDKVQLYSIIAEMYRSMGFLRKAALFTHFAARWASNTANSPDQALKGYNLITSCLSAYKLSPDLSDLHVPKNDNSSSGWPALQAQVLKEFVFLSRSSQKDEQAISHACYLLQHLSKHLSKAELQEITNMLGEISEQTSEGAQQNTSLASASIGKLQSPLPLKHFPSVKSVGLVELVELLKPLKIEGFVAPVIKKEESNSPFIFSPFEAKRRKEKQRPEKLWVVGNPGEVLMSVENTLPFELRVSKMSILIEGSKVDTFPASLTLPSKSEPQDIKLLTVPTEPGLLDIKGYEATVFGIRHECKVKIPDDYIVRVVPPLPEIRLRLALMSDETPLSPNREGTFRVGKSALTELELLDGEMCKCEFQLECLGKEEVPMEQVTVTVAGYDKDYCTISWDESELKALLPLSKGTRGSFTVSVCAKIPAWFRVLNEHTQGISKTTVFPSLKQDSRHSLNDSGHHSYSANTTPTESPGSSPVAKRSPLGYRSSLSRDPPSLNKEINLMDSLNLDQPLALAKNRNTNTLPFRRSPGHQRNTSIGGTLNRQKNRGSKRGMDRYDDPDWEGFKRASMVSTRSDPGEREDPKHRLKTGRASEPSKAIQIPKSSETRASPFSNSPQLYSDGSSSSAQSSVLHRTSSGNKAAATPRRQQALTKGHISVPMGPLIREKPQPPSKKRVEGEIKLQYTGGRGYLEGYCRQISVRLPAMVKPCLVFEQFEVLSAQVCREVFNLKFLTHNISKHRVEVSFSVEQDYDGGNDEESTSLTLDPNGRREVTLVIKRFVLSLDNPDNRNDSALAKLYSEKVSEVVKVHWKDLERNKVGVVSLDGLRLPVSTVSLLRTIPLTFGFTIDNQQLPVQESYSQECSVGSQLRLTLTMTNSSGVAMPPSFLHFEPNFYSQHQKTFLKGHSQYVLYSGSLVVNVPQLDPGETYEHIVALVFVLKGKYNMEVKSYMQVGGTNSFHVKIPISVSAPQHTTAPPESTAVDTVDAPSSTSSSPSLEKDTDSKPSPDSINLFSPTLSTDGASSPSFTNSLSPRQSPTPRRNVTSPDSPSANKALKMAKIYEAKVAARDATVYKDLGIKAKRKTSVDCSLEKNSSIEDSPSKVSSPAITYSRTKESKEQTDSDLKSTSSDHKSPSVKQRPRPNCDFMNTLLSEFIPQDYLLRSEPVSPAQVTTSKNLTPPPLPRGYHGTIKNASDDNVETLVPSTLKQESCTRFQKLLKLRAQNSNSVRVIAGPSFTFSVS